MKDDDKEREAHRRRIREAFDSLVADGLLVDSGRKRRSPITGEWQTVYLPAEVAEPQSGTSANEGEKRRERQADRLSAFARAAQLRLAVGQRRD
jgi:hypothetical protein